MGNGLAVSVGLSLTPRCRLRVVADGAEGPRIFWEKRQPVWKMR